MSRRQVLSAAAAAPAIAHAGTRAGKAEPSLPAILRAPDSVRVFLESDTLRLERSGGAWRSKDVVVTAEPRREGERTVVPISVEAPQSRLYRICLRWLGAFPQGWRYLGDVWERGYGDLEWRGLSPERIMPWYFAATNGRQSCGYGVRTTPGALCFWQVDGGGISLWLDVRCGAEGVRLGERRLEAATVAGVEGLPGEAVVRMTHRLCRALCPNPRLATKPFYGWNNWYCTGPTSSSAREVEEDAELLASLSPGGANRPYMVVDLGWEAAMHGAGPWEHGNAKFPDMPGLAAKIRSLNVIPGIWIRPLLMNERLAPALVLPPKYTPQEGAPPYVVMDPSVPEVLGRVRQAVRQLTGWGYRMIKFDFSTWDILGRWGFQMGADITPDGWSFADKTRTTAEIILGFYRAIREAAGDVPLIGCDVIGHLAAGLVELQRIGDDNGDQDWNRARKMGINALGFRSGQHNAFFAADADCAVFTRQIPSRMARQLLDLIARSGTPLFVSADPKLVDAGWKQAIREALEIASRPQVTIEPLDWMATTAPSRWRAASGVFTYDWYGPDGVNPLVR